MFYRHYVLSHVKNAWNVILEENMINKKHKKIIKAHFIIVIGKVSKTVYYIQNDTLKNKLQGVIDSIVLTTTKFQNS